MMINMKVLYAHAKNLKIEAGIPGRNARNRKRNERKIRERLGAVLPEFDKIENPIHSDNALLAFVCVEKGDEKVDLVEIMNDVVRARTLVGASDIVIGAFAHLSNNVAEPVIAKQIIDILVESIKITHKRTRQYPFGWDKSLEFCVPLHHYNIAFRSFEPKMEDDHK